MIQNMRASQPLLFKRGLKKYDGLEETTYKSLDACVEFSNILKTSFGPNGFNKILINYISRISITSDAASILKEMEVENPAVKMILLSSEMQEKEIGDGSNYIIILCGELCKLAIELLNEGVHVNDIIEGYTIAFNKVKEVIGEYSLNPNKSNNVNKFDISNPIMKNAIKSALSAKYNYHQSFLMSLVVDATEPILKNTVNSAIFNVDRINVHKVLGKTIYDSEVINGVVIDSPLEGEFLTLKNCKVAAFTCSLDLEKTDTKETILIKKAEQLLKYTENEQESIKKVLVRLFELGAKLIITNNKIGDIALQYIKKYKMTALEVNDKFNFRRVISVTNAIPFMSFNELNTYKKENLGFCSLAKSEEVGNKKLTFISSDIESTKITTILLRGNTENVMNNVEKAIEDGINCIKILKEKDDKVLYGGGAIEIELHKVLSNYKSDQTNMSSYSIKKFGEALLEIPRLLIKSAGKDETKILLKLIAEHKNENNKNIGFDVNSESICNVGEIGIYDSLHSKMNSMRLAIHTVNIILRIDSIIMSKPAGGPKNINRGGHWDED